MKERIYLSRLDMAESSVNTVRLTRENIDLKRRLDEAEELIDALKLKLSQQAKHVFTHEVRGAAQLSLADVLGGKSSASSVTTLGAGAAGGGAISGAVSAGEYDALEAELDESRQREEALRAQVQRLEHDLQQQARQLQQQQQSTPQRPRSHTFSHAAGGASEGSDTDLQSARKRIEALENSEKKLKAAVDDLNAALEATMVSTPPPPAHSSGGGGTTDERSPQLIEELEDKLLAEQAAQALLAEELEETKFCMEEEKREFDRKINEATSEKNIAVRVKNEALKEAASARTEAARLRGELATNKGSFRQQQHHQDVFVPSTPDALLLRDQVTFLESRLAAMQKDLDASQKDAARAHKAGKRAFLERQAALKDLEGWKAKQVESVKMKVTANAKNAMSMSSSSSHILLNNNNSSHHASSTHLQQQEHKHVETCVESAAQKLGVIQERLLIALTQRSAAAAADGNGGADGGTGTEVHHHHHHHYRDPHHGSPADAADQLSNTTKSVSSGDGDFSGGGGGGGWMVEEALFMGGDDWAHLVCEEFYTYERIIQNLKQEVLSLQTIAKMSDDEAAGHWKRKIEAMQDEMDVLRVTAHEYREAAATADTRHQQQMKGFFEAQQLQAQEYERHHQRSPQKAGETSTMLVGRVTSATAAASPGSTATYYHQPSYSSPGSTTTGTRNL